ncbi:MAG TPA: tetratricopeptide repeat protein [Chitinophagaceae bacterium]|nr:tetratricopeptide repeat protein [Chitinophagaceae bacterium]
MKKCLAAIVTTAILLTACNNNTPDVTPKPGETGNTLPKAVSDLYEAVRINPDSNNIRLKLAYALDSVNMADLALKQMDTLVSKDSTNYKLWLNRGSIAEDAKDTIKAMESYAKALHIYESPDGLLDLANLYAETKNPRALLICSRVKDMGLGAEYDASSAFIAGVYYARTHNRDAALQKFDECISNNYTYMEAYIEKGLVYFDNKQYNDALNVFNFAAKVNNLYADSYYYQARCYEMLNKKDSAVLRFKQSLGLDKNLTEAHAGLKRLGAE